MIIEKKEQTAQMTQDITQNNVGVKEDSVGFIINLMSSKLYKNRRAAFLREILSNAIDANAEAKVDNPVILRIYVDENRDFHVQIRDFGMGLSPERFAEVYINIASSTKRDDNSQQGGFGIGRFSALSFANYASVTSYYEGIRYEYAMYHDGDSTSIPKLLEAPTDEQNGVLVDIAFKNIIDYEEEYDSSVKEIRSILSLMLGRFSYFQNVFVELDFDFENEANKIKHSSVISEKENLINAVEKINSNLVLNKKHYIFSKNAYINGVNEHSDTDNVKDLIKSSSYDFSNHKSTFHIVVGENVYYPLDLTHLTSAYTDYKEYLKKEIEKGKDSPNYEKSFKINGFIKSLAGRNITAVSILNIASQLPLGIKIPIGVLDILPNREEFIYNKATSFKLLDIIFHDFLPEVEKDLILNNVNDFSSYEELLEFYKSFETYETIGNKDDLMIYLNHDEKLRIHIKYRGIFSNLYLSEQSSFKFYKSVVAEKFHYKINNERREKNLGKIILKTGKNYREFIFDANHNNVNRFSTPYNVFFFVSVLGKQIHPKVVKELLRFSVPKAFFDSPESLLGTTALNSYSKVQDLFKDSSLKVTAIGESGQITKRFAAGKTNTTNGWNFHFSNILAGKIPLNNTAWVFADIENLKPIQKAYLMSQIALHPFSTFKSHSHYSLGHHLHSVSGNSLNTIVGVGNSQTNVPVHFIDKTTLISKEEFIRIGLKQNAYDYYPERKTYFSQVSFLKAMINNMKNYQEFESIRKDSENRTIKAKSSFNKKIDKVVAEIVELKNKKSINDTISQAIKAGEREYSISKVKNPDGSIKWTAPKILYKEDGTEEENFEKFVVSDSDLKKDFVSINKGIEVQITVLDNKRKNLVKECDEVLTSIDKKYFVEALKAKGLLSNEDYIISLQNPYKNDDFSRKSLVNRDSTIFEAPQDVELIIKLQKEFFGDFYDFVLEKIFVDFSDVTEVSPEFEEEYLNNRKLNRVESPHSIINIKQLVSKGNAPKKYDSILLMKSTPQKFIDSFLETGGSVDKISKEQLKNIIFIYGNSGKSKLNDNTDFLHMFLYLNCFRGNAFQQYFAQDIVKYYFGNNYSKEVSPFIFLDIPVTKQKYFENNPYFIHIDDFMKNLSNYRQIRRLNTALLIESENPNIIAFSNVIVANPHLFRETLSSKIFRLAEFIKHNMSRLSGIPSEVTGKSAQAFRGELLERAKKENMFDLEMYEHYKSCKKELEDSHIILACSQDTLQRTFYLKDKPRSEEEVISNMEAMKIAANWKMSPSAITAGKINSSGYVQVSGYGNDLDSHKIHPILGDFLVKVLKDRKNIIPTFEACNQSVSNLNS